MSSSLTVEDTKMLDYSEFKAWNITSPAPCVLQVEMNRPSKRNAMNQAFWRDIVKIFERIATDKAVRVVVITGAGKIFTAGLDVSDLSGIVGDSGDAGRTAVGIKRSLLDMQRSFNIIESIPQPVIAAVHGGCIGGGVDMITACDIRVCSQDAFFSVREVDLALAADLGTLQRLPKVIGNQSLVRELAYTGRNLSSSEAAAAGLVSGVYADRDAAISAAVKLATTIASKSPVAVTASKSVLLHARDHSVADGLEFVAVTNAAMLQTKDIMEAVTSQMSKRAAVYSRL